MERVVERRGVGFAGLWDCGGGCLCAARYKPVRVNNRPSDVIAPRDTSVAFKWLLSRLCLDADVDLWNSIKLYGIPYRPKPGRRVSVVQLGRPRPTLFSFTRAPSPPHRRLCVGGEGALSRFTLLLFFPILPSNICSPTRKGVQLVLSIEFAIDALFFFDEDRDRFGWFTVGMDRRSFGDWTILKFHVS